MFSLYGIKFAVSAFAKRHGWNECDGAMARFITALKEAALENEVRPPTTAQEAVHIINMHEKFNNCTAYYFNKIDRNPAVFPEITVFKGIQKMALCEFKYEWTDYDGQTIHLPGYVLSRPLSGIGPWIFHDFLPRTRPAEWGKRCYTCSNKRARAVFHSRQGEPVRSCRQLIVREIVQPNADEIDLAAQPVARALRRFQNLGPDSVRCNLCPPDARVFKNKRGLKTHHMKKHRGFQMSFTPLHDVENVDRDGYHDVDVGVMGDADADVEEDHSPSPVSRSARSSNDEPEASSYGKEGESSPESSSDDDFGVNHAGLELYELDEIVGERGKGDDLEFLVYWRPRSKWPDASWHHHSNLRGCKEAIEAFRRGK